MVGPLDVGERIHCAEGSLRRRRPTMDRVFPRCVLRQAAPTGSVVTAVFVSTRIPILLDRTSRRRLLPRTWTAAVWSSALDSPISERFPPQRDSTPPPRPLLLRTWGVISWVVGWITAPSGRQVGPIFARSISLSGSRPNCLLSVTSSPGRAQGPASRALRASGATVGPPGAFRTLNELSEMDTPLVGTGCELEAL